MLSGRLLLEIDWKIFSQYLTPRERIDCSLVSMSARNFYEQNYLSATLHDLKEACTRSGLMDESHLKDDFWGTGWQGPLSDLDKMKRVIEMIGYIEEDFPSLDERKSLTSSSSIDMLTAHPILLQLRFTKVLLSMGIEIPEDERDKMVTAETFLPLVNFFVTYPNLDDPADIFLGLNGIFQKYELNREDIAKLQDFIDAVVALDGQLKRLGLTKLSDQFREKMHLTFMRSDLSPGQRGWDEQAKQRHQADIRQFLFPSSAPYAETLISETVARIMEEMHDFYLYDPRTVRAAYRIMSSAFSFATLTTHRLTDYLTLNFEGLERFDEIALFNKSAVVFHRLQQDEHRRTFMSSLFGDGLIWFFRSINLAVCVNGRSFRVQEVSEDDLSEIMEMLYAIYGGDEQHFHALIYKLLRTILIYLLINRTIRVSPKTVRVERQTISDYLACLRPLMLEEEERNWIDFEREMLDKHSLLLNGMDGIVRNFSFVEALGGLYQLHPDIPKAIHFDSDVTTFLWRWVNGGGATPVDGVYLHNRLMRLNLFGPHTISELCAANHQGWHTRNLLDVMLNLPEALFETTCTAICSPPSDEDSAVEKKLLALLQPAKSVLQTFVYWMQPALHCYRQLDRFSVQDFEALAATPLRNFGDAPHTSNLLAVALKFGTPTAEMVAGVIQLRNNSRFIHLLESGDAVHFKKKFEALVREMLTKQEQADRDPAPKRDREESEQDDASPAIHKPFMSRNPSAFFSSNQTAGSASPALPPADFNPK